MKRMTYRDENGIAAMEPKFLKDSHRQLVNALAAYEDTGLTPDQVEGLIEISRWIIRDSQSWEGDKQMCNASALRSFFTSSCLPSPKLQAAIDDWSDSGV